jgi:hypothetical protein
MKGDHPQATEKIRIYPYADIEADQWFGGDRDGGDAGDTKGRNGGEAANL